MRFDDLTDVEKAAADRVIEAVKDLPTEDGMIVLASIIAGTIDCNFCAEHAPGQLEGLIDLMREGLQAQIRGKQISEELKRRSLQ